MKASVTFISIFFISHAILIAQSNPGYRITNWMNNKQAAVCVTLDDGCDGQFKYALPAMNARNIRSTFFIISGYGYACSYNNWNLIKSAVNQGHEIGDHTVHHPHLTTLDSTDIEYELKVSDDSLLKILGKRPHIMAYPFGDGAGNNTSCDLVQKIAAKYYIGSRSAGAPPSGYQDYNDYQNPFYPDFYYQIASFPMDSTITLTKFTDVLDNSIKAGGWFIPMYHSIETGTLMTVSAAMFTGQMDSIHSRNSKIWIAPFGEQLKYHKEKRYAALSGQPADSQKWILNLSDNLPDSVFYQPLTIRLKKPWWNISSIVQNGATLSTVNDGDTIQFNATPDLGNIIIYKASVVTSLLNSSSDWGLDQNYPNPSEDYTTISYRIGSPSNVKLEIYGSDNLSMNTIKNEHQETGSYEIKLNTQNMAGGIYLYRLTTDAYTEIKRMVVLK